MAITKINLYNGEVQIYFDDLRHRYTLEDGTDIISVTHALDIVSKPQLIPWAANMAADSIAATLKPGVSYDELEIKAMVETARKAHYQKKSDAATIGVFVHDFVSKTIKGENPPVPVNEQLREACGKFLNWVEKHNVKFLASEQVVYSREFNFVGTLDFICKIDNSLYIGDLKTSSGIWETYKIQPAAYRFARTEEFSNEKYIGQLIVRIGKDGTTEIKIFEGDDNYNQLFDSFKNALDLTRAMEKVKLIK